MEDKKVKPQTIIYSILIIIVVAIIAGLALMYKLGPGSRFTRATVRFIPYPAAIINFTDFLSLNTLEKNLDSVRMFYEHQDFSSLGMRVDFNTPDGQKRLKIKEKELLNKEIENEIIKKLAEGRGIKVSSDDVKQAVDRKLNEYGSRDEVLKNLNNLYGWAISDFEEKIVRPDMYKEQLQASLKNSDKDMAAAKDKIDKALASLKNKESFSDVTKKYSDGESAKNGGELGWLTADQMIPEIAVASSIVDKGSRSDIIESSLGYHIIYVEDKKTESGVDKIKLSQIFVKSPNFSNWLLEQEKGFRIYIPIRDYFWDKGTQSVQFSSQEMRDFENNLEKNSPNDISVLF